MATPEGFNVIQCSGRQSIKGIFRSVESISEPLQLLNLQIHFKGNYDHIKKKVWGGYYF